MALKYLVCFDIEDDKIRRRMGNKLLEFGERVQYSVFEIKCRTESQLNGLKRELEKLMEGSENPGDAGSLCHTRWSACRCISVSHHCLGYGLPVTGGAHTTK
ncbi:CRISPR-associated endonuclease Cas2 [Vibrio sp. MEBiC08052]|uniref:CRISPR-associated endonuclease Cas2 n=1 Tax=Vibrio sp. MEBiC08052 TaxID=1761910 RepID=UPI0007406A05|nr:CRISPR-associated endonuclease Cas2 [Vibrio sp. MEBiC08052]KUI97422.1 CRISPR-associated protein Cas2 [Vibrio sp. MEBiC08052]